MHKYYGPKVVTDSIKLKKWKGDYVQSSAGKWKSLWRG